MGTIAEILKIKYDTPTPFKKEGVLNINNININFTLTNDYFESGEPDVSHLEFRSQIKGKANAITETGYRSHFFGVTSNEFNEHMMNNWQELIRDTVEENKRETIKTFNFSQGHEKEIATQGNLFG